MDVRGEPDIRSKPLPCLCVSDALEQSLDPGVTEWERSREREEFVRASILYRPTSSSLSSRFTRAKQQEDDDSVEVSRDQEVKEHLPPLLRLLPNLVLINHLS